MTCSGLPRDLPDHGPYLPIRVDETALVLGPPSPSPDPCDVVHIEWDRGHEHFDALLYVHGGEGLVIAKVHDYWPLTGCLWLRRTEVLRAEAIEPSSAAVRVLDRLGVRFFTLDPKMGSLRAVMREAQGTPSPIAVYTRSTGSREVLVGLLVSLEDTSCTMADVSPAGERTGEDLHFELEDIIGLEWGTDYLMALAILLES